MENRTVYVLLSRTQTGVGSFIRMFMPGRYSHVALAFDPYLSEMYTFARLHVDTPFAGGFLKENPAHYLHGGRDAAIKLHAIELDEAQALFFERELERLEAGDTCYNLVDAFLLAFKKRMRAEDGAHTCVSFSAHMLGLNAVNEVLDMEKALEGFVIYEGFLRAYLGDRYDEQAGLKDEYFKRRGLFHGTRDTFKHVRRLVRRLRGKK